MHEMQGTPLTNQRVESQRGLCSFPFGLLATPGSLSTWIDALSDRAQPCAHRLARLLDGEITPDPEGFADLPLRRRVRPLRNKGSGSLRGDPDAEARAVGVEYESIFLSVFEF